MKTIYRKSDLPKLWDVIDELVDEGKQDFSRLTAEERNQVYSALVQDMPGEFSDLFYDPQHAYGVTEALSLFVRSPESYGPTLRSALTRALKANHSEVIDRLFAQMIEAKEALTTWGYYDEEKPLDNKERAKDMNQYRRL